MSGAIVLMMMMQHEEQRRRRQAEERRRREERERKRRQEEERKRQEEQRRMVEHRKNSPVVSNGEQWQENRIVKAISMQPSVQGIVSAIEAVRPIVIEDEERKYDERILEVGYEYESVKSKLDRDIETLRESGISITGTSYELCRLTPTDSLMPKPVQAREFYGNTFIVMDGQPIILNPRILSSERYYEKRYEEMNPEELEKEFTEISSKLKKYQKYGKYLSFLLRTRKYLDLKGKSEDLSVTHEQCELRKKEMQSYQALTEEQLLAIKSYFEHLEQLVSISSKIKELFREKAALRNSDNERIYDLTIKEILTRSEYQSLVLEAHEYITKIYANDEETMKNAFELVKGEYPINIQRKYIYDLIIANIKKYSPQEQKRKKLS